VTLGLLIDLNVVHLRMVPRLHETDLLVILAHHTIVNVLIEFHSFLS